jgi:ABC-2 type transport system permease protein
MPKLIVRLLAFFGKEINEIRRQPRLWLSLLLGPFLILLLFGLGYSGGRPPLRVALVVPPDLVGDERLRRAANALANSFELVSMDIERDRAMERLRNDEVDVVEVLPANFESYVEQGKRAPMEFIYSEINPQEEQYLRYSAFLQIDAINDIFVSESVAELQTSAEKAVTALGGARGALDTLAADSTSPSERQTAAEQLAGAADDLALLAASPTLSLLERRNGTVVKGTQDSILNLHSRLADLSQAPPAEPTSADQENIRALREELGAMQDQLNGVASIPPDALVEPLKQQYHNLQGDSLDLMSFFAPGVAALILQHISVTLSSLSLVRERYRGALEFFAAAPVSILQVFVGKYLAYLLFGGVIAAGLTLLMVYGLGVPFLGDVWLFVGVTVLFLLASIGLGFAISVFSNSDTQAVQLSMLVLLLSIFFSGFVLPLNQFNRPVRYIGYVAPMTHGMQGYQDILLLGKQPEPLVWIGLGAIAGISFLIVLVIGYRQFRRLA